MSDRDAISKAAPESGPSANPTEPYLWAVHNGEETAVTIQWILNKKGQEVWSADPDSPVIWALELMAEQDIGALLVMEDQKLIGIISERDYAREVALRGKSSPETPIKEIMTRQVPVISPEASLKAALMLMTENDARYLPVIQSKKVVGVISIGDVVKEVIGQQDFKIGQLENYIVGAR